MKSLRRVGVIALGELKRTGGSFDRKAVAGMIALSLALGLVMPSVIGTGLDFDRGLYRVAVEPESPLRPAVETASAFQVLLTPTPHETLAAGHVDLAIEGDTIQASPTDKGRAALHALRDAAKAHTFRIMLTEGDAAAAFPVRVDVEYEEQAAGTGTPRLADAAPPTDSPRNEPSDETPTGTTSGGNREPTRSSTTPTTAPADGGFDFLSAEEGVNTPGNLNPSFPFKSLLLAYLFLIPLNFIVQVYAGSAIHERLGRKGEAMLASPARPWEIIAGKALPYFTLMMAAGTAIAIFIGGGWVSILAVVPLALAFLAFEFVSAMYARSFRELTFLTVFASVLLTIYCFLPAVFSDVHPVALISPITLVVMDLKGATVSTGALLYATLPLTLVSAVLFLLGGALYREEDLFHQKPVLQKAVDSVARQVRGKWSAFKLSILLIPFVFVGELLLVTFLFAWPFPSGLFTTLVAVALVEEAFKAAPSYAAVARGRITRTTRSTLVFGAIAGLGFFAAEKGFLLASLVGLYDLPAGTAVFGAAGGGATGAGAWWPLLLVGPLVLHVVTAAMSGWGAGKSRSTFGLAFTAAVLTHALYNLTIVVTLGGGLP